MNKNILVELETQNEYGDSPEISHFLVKSRDIVYYTEKKQIKEKIFIVVDFLEYCDGEDKYTYIKTDNLEKALEIFCDTLDETLISFETFDNGSCFV